MVSLTMMMGERERLAAELRGLRARRRRALATRHRLAAELRALLVAGSRAGVPVPELAWAAGVRRETVWAIVREAAR